jgi:hypothetical protein
MAINLTLQEAVLIERFASQIRDTLDEVMKQIYAIKEDAKRQDINPYSMRTVQGDYVLAPLLLAQANLNITLASILNKYNN